MISHTPSARPSLMPNHPPGRFAFNACQQTTHGIPASSEAASGSYRALVAAGGDAAMQKSLEAHLAALERTVAVDFADDEKSVLEKASTTQYDLVFLGPTIRGFDGYEICSRLRKMPEYKKTPIVMVAGEVSPLDAMRGVKAGCTTYLAKPLRQEVLQSLSRRVLA